MSGDLGVGLESVAPAIAPLEKRRDVADWFYVPSWRRTLRSRLAADKLPSDGLWLVIGEDGLVAKGVAHALRAAGHQVVRAAAGDGFAKRDDGAFGFNPGNADDYVAMVREVRGLGTTLVRIVHLLSATGPGDAVGSARLDRARGRGFQSVINLARALGQDDSGPIEIVVVTTGAHEVTGGEELYPEAATVCGPCQVIPQEYPHISCRQIDLEFGRNVTVELVAELAQPRDGARRVALRAGQRWVQTYEPTPLPRVAIDQFIERRGAYLLTGGPEGLGYEIARYLAEYASARIVFVDPVELPSRGNWTPWLMNHAADDPTSRRIFNLQWLESHGGQVTVYRADLGDPVAVAAAVERAYRELGGLNGLFHAAGFGGESDAIMVERMQPGDGDEMFRKLGLTLYGLEAALAGKQLDFVSIHSSLATVLGGVGLASYAGVNHFLDAFVQAHNRLGEGPTWTAIDWNHWRLSGDAAADRSRSGTTASLAIIPEDGFDVLRRAIASGASQVIVSTACLESRLVDAALTVQLATAGAPDVGAAEAPEDAETSLVTR